jgi:release factor H-coupled RctB family protein
LDFESLLINSEVSATISILAKKSFVDPEANAQLNRTAMLPGMRKVVGQPDLHPGKKTRAKKKKKKKKKKFFPSSEPGFIRLDYILLTTSYLMINWILTGNQYPIGATFITQKFIYPTLIGNDIVSLCGTP